MQEKKPERNVKENINGLNAISRAVGITSISKVKKSPTVKRVHYCSQNVKRFGFNSRTDLLVLVKIKKGNRYRGLPKRGRSPSKYRSKIDKKLSHQRVAEAKATSKHKSFKIKGSYKLVTTPYYQYFQIVLTPK